MIRIIEPDEELALRKAAFATLVKGDLFRFYRGVNAVHAICSEIDAEAIWAFVLDERNRVLALEGKSLIAEDLHLEDLSCLAVFK